MHIVDYRAENPKECELLEVVQRRFLPNTNRVRLEIIVAEEVTNTRIKFFVRETYPRLIKILRDIPSGVFDVELPLQCGPGEQIVDVYVEGFVGSELIQCDGAVATTYRCGDDCTTCECRGDCPNPCVERPEPPACECGGDPQWDDESCSWLCVGECGCVPEPEPECECGLPKYQDETCTWECPDCNCVAPPPHNFSLTRPIGNPGDECGYFGNYVPGSPGDFYVTKCGLDYFVTETPLSGTTCPAPSGKDISHVTGCVCKEEE